ncbi:DUF6678 family protein [[Eubacterium] hominis]|uniref:DUF6678 family protein n=1 Tax=[Eubacterium] hominis TaxID=2764325 RepID=UPI003A4E2B72
MNMETNGKTLPNTGFNDIDFGSGIRQNDGILSVYWPDGVRLKLQKDWMYLLTIERDGYIFTRQRFKKLDHQLLIWVERFAKDISAGRYKTKKTEKEMILDIITKRNLVSFMNNTKWQELRVGMLNEMPFVPPYEYKTLFDDNNYILEEYVQHLIKNEGPNCFYSLDEESFNFLNYKAMEWLKVRPRFFMEDGGLLVKKKVWYDCEKEFIEILKKYSIPYELENGVYTIYGYR